MVVVHLSRGNLKKQTGKQNHRATDQQQKSERQGNIAAEKCKIITAGQQNIRSTDQRETEKQGNRTRRKQKAGTRTTTAMKQIIRATKQQGNRTAEKQNERLTEQPGNRHVSRICHTQIDPSENDVRTPLHKTPLQFFVVVIRVVELIIQTAMTRQPSH